MEYPRLLAVKAGELTSRGLQFLLDHAGIASVSLSCCREALHSLSQLEPDVVVLDCPGSAAPGDNDSFSRLLELLDAQGIGVVVLAGPSFHRPEEIPDWVQWLEAGVGGEELYGRVASIRHYRQVVRRAQLELDHMQRVGRHLSRHFTELDQDMRLAGHLQRAFLPESLPQVDGLRFSVLYRPAGWVSGDIYDIARVDEDHLAVYVADAVGHGMAASLLTIFVKRSLHSKSVGEGSYRILSPSQTLQQLNDAIAAEKLKNSQFVTAGYCLLNHRDMTLSFARGGHPHPIVVDADGRMSELRAEGGLLGLFPGQEFPTKRIQLRPGQKFILYSDGMELAFVENRNYHTGEPRYRREFQKLAHLPGEQLIARLENMIDGEEGSLNPRDDVTMVIVEALR